MQADDSPNKQIQETPKRYFPTEKEKKEFENIFDLKLKDYFSIQYGFDVCKFNDDLKCPDGISLNDFLLQTYGDAGLLSAHKMNNYGIPIIRYRMDQHEYKHNIK